MNKQRFTEIMSGLCDLYDKDLNEFTLDIYWNIFDQFTAEQFERGVHMCLKNRKYAKLPKPAEILEYIEGTSDDKALIAWGQVQQAIKEGGYLKSIDFADKRIPYCINQLGGWQWLCGRLKTDMPFIEKRFCDLYRLAIKRKERENAVLIGYIEQTNMKKGEMIEEPLKIGYEYEDNLLTKG